MLPILTTAVVLSLSSPLQESRPLQESARPAQPPAPTADEVLEYLGFGSRDRRDFLAGKIISGDFPETSDKELSITVAMVVPTSLARVVELIRAGETFDEDSDVAHFKDLGDRLPEERDFAGVQFGAAEAAEVRRLLNVRPGSDCNLGAEEIRRFQTLRRRYRAGRPERTAACRQAVAAEYRRVLLERCREYREKGLAGIAPYSRGGKTVANPGEELRGATEAAKFLTRRFPDFFRVLMDYPAGGAGDAAGDYEHRFYWIKQRVEDRPTFVLAHRIFYGRPDGALITERQFFVGHSYNCLQIIVGCLPAGDRTMVFYLNRTSTDQVAGFPVAVRHSLGRGRMREKIVAYFEALREAAQARRKEGAPKK